MSYLKYNFNVILNNPAWNYVIFLIADVQVTWSTIHFSACNMPKNQIVFLSLFPLQSGARQSRIFWQRSEQKTSVPIQSYKEVSFTASLYKNVVYLYVHINDFDHTEKKLSISFLNYKSQRPVDVHWVCWTSTGRNFFYFITFRFFLYNSGSMTG